MSDQQPYDRLKPLHRTALLFLLKGDQPQNIADRLDITPRTLRRWRKQPDFEAAFAAARTDFFSACHSEINAARAQAFTSLNQVARFCGDTAVQVRAATTLLEYVSRLEMSAPTAPTESQPNVLNNLVPFAPDKRGHPRTFPDKPGL